SDMDADGLAPSSDIEMSSQSGSGGGGDFAGSSGPPMGGTGDDDNGDQEMGEDDMNDGDVGNDVSSGSGNDNNDDDDNDNGDDDDDLYTTPTEPGFSDDSSLDSDYQQQGWLDSDIEVSDAPFQVSHLPQPPPLGSGIALQAGRAHKP
ncbi:hypothetical protein FRB93_011477, partial [Tulasnella sp. JGI-2019a]